MRLSRDILKTERLRHVAMLELFFARDVYSRGRRVINPDRKARYLIAAEHAARSAKNARKLGFPDDATELEIVSCEFIAATNETSTPRQW